MAQLFESRLSLTHAGLDFNPGFYISVFIGHFGIIIPIVFRALNLQIVEQWN